MGESLKDGVVEESRDEVYGWFRQTLPDSFFESLKRDLGIVENSCVFKLSVTAWLMIVQRLSHNGTLASAVSELIHGNGRELLEPCKRVREENVSANTGAYSHARQRMPVEAARRVAQRTFEQLREVSPPSGLRSRAFLLDGSSIRLSHTAAILKIYPPAENQNGKSHWPVARVTVMNHLVTGMAMAPVCGPMYGPEAVSEQSLAETLIGQLPPSSVLIGDRNFGVFSVLWCAHSQGHAVLTRLMESRAKRLAGGDPDPCSDRKMVWEVSREDRRNHPELPTGARIEGRLIVTRPEHMRENLYLFTTLEEPVEQIVALYQERWHIETDLRSLKEQVRLHTIPAKSPDMVVVELLMAIASYNLIRAVMHAAAKQIGVEPRRLSFSRSREAFWAFARATAHLHSPKEFDPRWARLLRSIAQCKLPLRNRPPEPRLIWIKPHGFPFRKLQK